MDDRVRLEQLIGRPPQGDFDVVVRDRHDDPVVIRNAPFLLDGTPMPTRYYLVGPELVRAVSRIEADGGVRAAERDIDEDTIEAIHRAYAAERDAAIEPGHAGPRPSGGVGGTRQGVKCLHAHVAHLLAGGDDAIGAWTLDRLGDDAAVLDGLRPTPEIGAGAGPEVEAVQDDAGAAGTGAVDTHAGGVTIRIDDDATTITMTGGGTWTMPVGPHGLLDQLDRDPPAPSELTNALGLVHDHFDDVVVEAPIVLATPSVTFTGAHAHSLARVELGADRVPSDYVLVRSDADEVFRTLVSETRDERRHNPGLDTERVDTVVTTLCVVLAIVRRLDLGQVRIVGDDAS